MGDMFRDSDALIELNLLSFDTSKVEETHWMFYNCDSLTVLDLSSFDTSNVTSIFGMFNSCDNLETIYASDSFVTTRIHNYDTNGLFDDSTKLVGGSGSPYNSYYIDRLSARIDEPSLGRPGYFTRKS